MKIEFMKDLTEDWADINEIVVYGLGRIGMKNIKRLIKDFNIPFIIDNDIHKCGTTFSGIPVYSLSEVKSRIANYKVVVMAGALPYLEISGTLDSVGMKENENYCSFRKFISEWYWRFKGILCLSKTDISLTTRCTLCCDKCQLFLPYNKKRKNYRKEDIMKDIDAFFNIVDYVFSLGLLGGEPFMYEELDKIIKYIVGRYNDRIGHIVIFTNGTIIPDAGLLQLIRENEIIVEVSEYTSVVKYKVPVDQIIGVLEDHHIEYIRNQEMVWYDMGFPKNQLNLTEKEAKMHMKKCNPQCAGINDGKYYFCKMAWAAEQTGLFKNPTKDYVDLYELKNEKHEAQIKILAHSQGMIEGGALEFCKYCRGFGSDNDLAVRAGIQYDGT